MTTPQPPPASAARLLGIVRWVLPLGLAVIAVVIEWTEHVAIEEEAITPALRGRGRPLRRRGPRRRRADPDAGWPGSSRVIARRATALESMNRSLEANVAERTRHLEEATAQLAAANDEPAPARPHEVGVRVARVAPAACAADEHQWRARDRRPGRGQPAAGKPAHAPDPDAREPPTLAAHPDHPRRQSRLESGRLTLRLGPVAVEPLLARACATTLGCGAGARWSARRTRGPAAGLGRRASSSRRSSGTCVENAAHYTPAGSPVEVSAHARAIGSEITRDRPRARRPSLRSSEQIFRVVLPTRRCRTRRRPGYGLGLYFADRLVRAQHGEIAVESPVWPDVTRPGARFWSCCRSRRADPDDPESDVPRVRAARRRLGRACLMATHPGDR